MNRRSFLGLLAASVLAKQVAKAGPVAFKPGVGISFPMHAPDSQDWWMPFMISDWATLQPGEIANAVLFGGEQPEEFLLKSIGARIASSASVKDSLTILGGETSPTDDEYVSNGAWMEIKIGDLKFMESPLWYLPGIGAHPLPYPVMFSSAHPFGARILSSAPLAISKPTMVFMALQGDVRMTPEQVERCRAAWEAEESNADLDTSTVG